LESSPDHTRAQCIVQSLCDKLFYGSNAKHFYSQLPLLFWNKQQDGRTCWLNRGLSVRRRETASVSPLLLQNVNPATFRFLTSRIGTSDIFRVRFTVSPNSGRAAALNLRVSRPVTSHHTYPVTQTGAHLYIRKLHVVSTVAYLCNCSPLTNVLREPGVGIVIACNSTERFIAFIRVQPIFHFN